MIWYFRERLTKTKKDKAFFITPKTVYFLLCHNRKTRNGRMVTVTCCASGASRTL
jgi:hypothetical protein